GKPDLAVTDNSAVSVLLGNGDGTFQPNHFIAADFEPETVAVGDFNGDGKPDLAFANLFGSDVGVVLGNGDGTFQAARNFFAVGFQHDVAVGDFNGDGKPDLAVAHDDGNDNGVNVLVGNGDGTFQAAQNLAFAGGAFPNSVATGDFNGDGKPDLAVAN